MKKTALTATILCMTFSSAASADQVILNDLIVDGSACIGQDCVNGESFGFDTIRIKENNLRIRAVDTSSTSSFPTNDWQITFNDSSNGGQNKFSIDDIDGGRTPFTIEASAPSHSLYVDDGGRIGMGTATPVVSIHVKDGNTPTLRLEQDGSSGFTPQTWDAAGNEANFFIRDATNGSTLPFRIQPAAPSNSVYIASDGDVGFGTSTPAAGNSAGRFTEVKDSTSAAVVVDGGGDAGEFGEFLVEMNNTPLWGMGYRANNQGFYIYNYPNTRQDFAIAASTGNVGLGTNAPDHNLEIVAGAACSEIDAGETAFTNCSSRTIKDNITPFDAENILDKIANVGVYSYDFIEGPKGRVGLMAEDFHTVFERGTDQKVSGHEVQLALWLAVQELTAKVAELEAKLEAAEGGEH